MKKALILIFAIFLLALPLVFAAAPTHSNPLLQETTGGTETNLTFVNQTGAGTKPLVFNYVSEYKKGGIFIENGSRWYNNSDCIAYYPFDQNNKSDFCRNNDLYSSSGAVDSVKGIVREGFDYENAEADKLGTDQDANFRFSGTFCAGAWVKRESDIVSTGVILSMGNGVDGGWYMMTHSSVGDRYRWGIYHGQEVDTSATTSIIPLNEWHHIVGVYDDEQIRKYIYVDGNITSNTTVGGTGIYMTSSLPFGVGGNSQVAGFDGLIDEAFIYTNKTNCDSHKITKMYDGTKSGFGIINSTFYEGTIGNYAVNMTICDSEECGATNRATGGGPDTTPPSITNYSNQGSSCTNWNLNPPTPCTTSDTTPTLYFNTSEAAYCAIAASSWNYTQMGGSRNCTSGEGTTEHACDLRPEDELVYEDSTVYLSCKDSSGNMNKSGESTSGPLSLTLTGLEAARRNSIGLGIQNALLSGYTNYTDLQIYARNLSNSQVKGTFDRAAKKGTKLWAFNGIGVSDSHVNMFNLTPVLYTLELANKTSSNITLEVEKLINLTKG